MNKNVAIVHYNTPELTEAAIFSLRKHGGEEYKVYVFDNSDERPFKYRMKGVKVFDNTRSQIIDFDKELAKYPDRHVGQGNVNNFASDKHMMSVQKLWELIPDGFVLMDSDVLIKENIDWMFMADQCCCGYVSHATRHGIPRLMPMLLWINVPMCRKGGARFFDPDRSWALHPLDDPRSSWDTGAAFLDDIKRLKPQCHGKSVTRDRILQAIVHLGSGSWKQNDIKLQAEWLKKYESLWSPTPRMRGIKDVAVCAIGRNENRYAVEWVEHYKALGVKKIFIYDNWRTGDAEKLADVLQPYVESGLVEITDCHDRERYQCKAYEDCYRRHGNEYAWMGFLDFDEFLRWEGRKKIASMFQLYLADAVLVNWRTMTDNGLVHYDPRPLAERFPVAMEQNKCVKYSWPENRHVKPFIRGGIENLRFAGPHNPHSPRMRCVNVRGEVVEQKAFTDTIEWEPMRIDHYWTKTAEEWMKVKLSRGYPSPTTYIEKFMPKQAAYFFAVNEWTEEKENVLAGKDG